MPLTATSARCASSATSAPSAVRSSPSCATACASARMARIFGKESPQARSFSSLAASTVSALSGARMASTRLKIALALAVDTCWATMIRTRPAKPGSCRRRGVAPPISISLPTISGSSARSLAAASASACLAVDERAGMIENRRFRPRRRLALGRLARAALGRSRLARARPCDVLLRRLCLRLRFLRCRRAAGGHTLARLADPAFLWKIAAHVCCLASPESGRANSHRPMRARKRGQEDFDWRVSL